MEIGDKYFGSENNSADQGAVNFSFSKTITVKRISIVVLRHRCEVYLLSNES